MCMHMCAGAYMRVAANEQVNSPTIVVSLIVFLIYIAVAKYTLCDVMCMCCLHMLARCSGQSLAVYVPGFACMYLQLPASAGPHGCYMAGLVCGSRIVLACALLFVFCNNSTNSMISRCTRVR